MFSKLREEGYPSNVAAGVESVLLYLHAELCKMTPEHKKLFWETDIKDRVKEFAKVRKLNEDIG